MIDAISQFFIVIIRDVPVSAVWALVLLFCLCSILFLSFLGGRKGITWSAGLLLLEYLFLILLLSVLLRKVQEERVFYAPFWSYRAIFANDTNTLIQVIINICAYVPVGLLVCCVFNKIKWWVVLIVGGAFSILIETLQFVFKLGFSEFDDVFHNVLGCLIGYGVYEGINYLLKTYNRQNSN